jgi:hypothetical protein
MTSTAAPDVPPPAKKAKRNAAEDAMPLAERMRPKTLDELVGHEDLVGQNGVLRELILSDRVPSMILWAGPGVRPNAFFVDDRSAKRHWHVSWRTPQNLGSKS